jgi:NAD(P)-dependent dehydrogenase (short-subunit alcohol dehydrogenase family)
MKLKSIRNQVVVITGASSGIGRETALQFAQRGAKVVAAARSEHGLRTLVQEIERKGGNAIYQVCDVTNFQQVKALASKAAEAFGRIDTWVNNAAVAVYAHFENTTPEEFRRVLEVNLMGQVHGAQAALPYLREAGGGALICVSSVESQVSLPLHSAYASSKHGITGFVDALRRELMHEVAPISVTNIMPATINTPFFNKALSKIGVKPQGPPPIYQPSVVARLILYAAEHPERDLLAGGAAKAMVTTQKAAPRLMDAVLSSDRFGFQSQKTDEPKSIDAPTNFYEPMQGDNRTEGDFSPRARGFSLYDMFETRTVGRLIAGGLLGAAFMMMRGSGEQRRQESAS